ncbi:hypothetical protein [Acidisarcina polymorpha]|uniref:hypothetical protein n=1 Tax=Acidisarcina polymorpha TaxID=2211140 RepID=UPI000DEEF27B|nr:hypothetical protein [Acidisarcina polymorpha]
MYIPSSLRIAVLGLIFSSAAFAQSPVAASPAPPTVPPAAAPAPPPQQVPMVTQSSRVRAFNAGPRGEARSLYLQNGSVVNLAPGLGGQIGPTVRKGEKITVTGTKSEINGQSLVEAASVRLNDQTFSANDPAPGPLAEGVEPPPPGASQAPPAPAPGSRNRAAVPAPCGAAVNAPSPPRNFGGPPPPPPDGMAPPPAPPQN